MKQMVTGCLMILYAGLSGTMGADRDWSRYPMQGDWYARHMYLEGHPQYKHHVKHYGHPSEFGYKDLIELFNPEQLDFDRLVGLYKKAGAKYAVLLAVHHDNFDLWDSQHHEWNSVNKGPKRDLVGEFRDATRKHDLRFGVTTHLARTYSWLQTSHGAEKEATANRFGGIRDVESFVPGDLRFVVKDDHTLHAFLMAYPEKGELTIQSLPRKPWVRQR